MKIGVPSAKMYISGSMGLFWDLLGLLHRYMES